jgi:hypothetical protein
MSGVELNFSYPTKIRALNSLKRSSNIKFSINLTETIYEQKSDKFWI